MGGDRTQPGALIDNRFMLRRQLGKGGMATVWRAHDQTEGRDVALKLLHPKYRASAPAVTRLRREADVLHRLDHPNIARALNIALDRPQPFFVMELIRGSSLDVDIGLRAETDHYFEDAEIRTLFEQLCSAVSAAHAIGVVHRDLKPTNVMVVREGGAPQIKVLDFAVAKLLDTGAQETTQGRAVGSLSYMAPEQAEGAFVDERVDIYALGLILFELVTLRRAWARNDEGEPLRAYAEPVRSNTYNSPASLAVRLSSEDRPVPSKFRASVLPGTDAVIQKAMALERTHRFVRAEDLFAAVPGLLTAAATIPDTKLGSDHRDGETAVRPNEPDTRVTEFRPSATQIDEPPGQIRTTLVPQPRSNRQSWRLAGLASLFAAAAVAGVLSAGDPPAPQVPAPVAEPAPVPRRAPGAVAAPRRAPAPSPVTATDPPAHTQQGQEGPKAPTKRVARPRPNPGAARSISPRAASVAGPSAAQLRKQVAAAGADPGALEAVAKRIAAAAAQVKDETKRGKIKRIAIISAELGDTSGVNSAVDLLEQELRR